MTLRPDKTIHKALISTTSRLVGEYERGDILITHAWPDFYIRFTHERMREGPLSRNAFILTFKQESDDKNKPFPIYSPFVDWICLCLSILYGKRFDSHGIIEGSGLFFIPDMTQFGHICDQNLPQNTHQPRIDFQIQLDLSEISRIEELFLSHNIEDVFFRTLQNAGKFYLEALQNVERDPQIAYLHLITAGEILSGFYKYKKEDLIDSDFKKILARIREGMKEKEGSKVAKYIMGKQYLVKRRFIETICKLVDDDFFEKSEAIEPFARFKLDTFRDSIGAAYDLRSNYVHTGVSFGTWISNIRGMNNEVQIGKPITGNKDFDNTLFKAPTYLGLERVVRYCLMKFIQQYVSRNIKQDVIEQKENHILGIDSPSVPKVEQDSITKIVNVALGNDASYTKVEATLAQLEAQGYHLTAPIRAIWAGQRDSATLTEGLDDIDAALVQLVLALLAEGEEGGEGTAQ